MSNAPPAASASRISTAECPPVPPLRDARSAERLRRLVDAHRYRRVVAWSQNVPQVDATIVAMRALTADGLLFGEQGRFEDALRSLDQAVTLAGGAADSPFQSTLAGVFMTKASLLDRLGRNEAALETHEKAIALFTRSKDVQIQEICRRADSIRPGYGGGRPSRNGTMAFA